MKRNEKTPSRTSPKNAKRGCLCKDSNTYHVDCCDGSLWAQGIGRAGSTLVYLAQENGSAILQENRYKIEI